MVIWLQEFGIQLLIWILGFIDAIFSVFGAVSGITEVTTTEGSTTLSSFFLGSNAITQAFMVIFLISVGLCAVCTVVAIVKTIINGGEKKSHAKTVGQSAGSILVTVTMMLVMLVFIGGADLLLGTINKSLNGQNTLVMSREIINVSVGTGYEYDNQNIQGLNEYDENGNVTYTAYLYAYATVGDSPEYFVENDIEDGHNLIVYLDPDGKKYKSWKDVYTEVLDKDGNVLRYDVIYSKLSPVPTESGWVNENTKYDISEDILKETPEFLFGTYGTSFGFPTEWKLDGKIKPNNFNFLIAFICSVVILVALLGAVLGLVKRLFDLALLFLALPVVSATIPLDDGAKFKVWRETVVSKVMLAFGSVLAVNVFFIIAPSLWEVGLGGTNAFADSVLKVVLIVGGALTISGGQLLFARLVGGDASESRDMTQSARALVSGGAAMYGAAKSAGRLVFGAKNADGKRVGGLIKGGANVSSTAAGGADAVGKLLGGDRYTNSRASRGMAATQRALHGFGSSAGWGSGALRSTVAGARGEEQGFQGGSQSDIDTAGSDGESAKIKGHFSDGLLFAGTKQSQIRGLERANEAMNKKLMNYVGSYDAKSEKKRAKYSQKITKNEAKIGKIKAAAEKKQQRRKH